MQPEINNQIIIYQSADGQTTIDVKMEQETVWLTQAQMAELFQKDRTVIGRHIRNIFNEGELEESLVCAKFAHTKKYGRREGFSQAIETVFYNLDVIISVGYRVKSQRGTQFRIWANRIAATLFLWFMQNNGILYNANGTKRISNGTLVALTLMIAESCTEEKDVMIKVVVKSHQSK